MLTGFFPRAQSPDEAGRYGDKIISRLRRGELPQMVDWFDPGLLAKVGVRSIISATLGQYTDQRLMQAATDSETEETLAARYDYSGKGKSLEALAGDASGAVWVDYIADLGDGFESTYAMAYLMAPEELAVEGEANPLPAGRLLIMGGDQVYPDATPQEYQRRLRDPYDWAFTTEEPKRKLFAIPGNHDWYDGLCAFSALFCSARDRISRGMGTQIGGWRCHQHRSYFAIKLPHKWWIWGPDIQLADNLDDSQRDYFDLMAEQTRPGDNIILCLAEPSWLHKSYDNMHEISMLARKNGAKICAVIAGDWHHYSRYTSQELGIQFITCGGGGAFAHATHALKRRIAVNWATPTDAGRRISDPSDTTDFNRLEKTVIGPEGPDFTLNPSEASTKTDSTETPEPKPISDVDAPPLRRAKAMRKEDITSAVYKLDAPCIYPARWWSRLLCLKNLTLPFRNTRFAVLVGVIYFIYAWAWSSSDPRQSPIMLKLAEDVASQAETARTGYAGVQSEIADLEKQVAAAKAKQPEGAAPSAELALLEDELNRARAAEPIAKQNWQNLERRSQAVDGGRRATLNEQIRQLEATPELTNNERLLYMWRFFQDYSPLDEVLNPTALLAACEQGPLFAFLLIGLWVGLVFYVELPWTWPIVIAKVLIGTAHFSAHLLALLFISWLANGISVPLATLLKHHMVAPWPDVIRIAWNFGVTLLLGGMLGGLIMGLYWTLTSTLFNMHTGDAFGALGVRHYKHFLRIKLEPNRATVYPIAIDKVPGRYGWRWKLKRGEELPAHNPQIMPVKPLAPHLIEPPIVISAEAVQR